MTHLSLQIQDVWAYYNDSGEHCFFGPDYGRPAKALIEFKKTYPALTEQHIQQLKCILIKREVGSEQIFAADLLYMYRPIPLSLFEPMIDCAIDFRDPSFNRIFLRPCMKAFGDKAVADMLQRKFLEGDIIRRIGIASLKYWFWFKQYEDVQAFIETVVAHGNQSDNLVEKYIYSLSFKIESDVPLPTCASELIKAVRHDEKYLQLLRNLGWETKDR